MFDDSRSASAQNVVKSLARLAAEEAFSAPRDAPVIERIPGISRPESPVAEAAAATQPALLDTRIDTRAPRTFRVAPAQGESLQVPEAIAVPVAPLPRPVKTADTRRPGPVHVVYNAPARPVPVILPAATSIVTPTTPRDSDSRIQAGLDLALSQVAGSEFKDVTRRIDALKAVLATIQQAQAFRISG